MTVRPNTLNNLDCIEGMKKLEDGSVDYKQQDLVTQVNKGDLLAVYTEPTSGKKDGRTVTGVVIEAKPGAGREVRAGEHIRVERHEGAIHYYAETDGRLLYEDGGSGDGGLSVDPVLTIDGDVGPETGNIDFLGSVHVHGDVDDNYTVTAKNGIVIDGSVRGAVLQSDGDIEVKNGIIGKNRAKVLARGSITAKFAESARIKACGCITIRHGAMNCLILSGNRIMSLEHKGHVVGGTLEAKYGVEVKELGNELENRTEVSVGRDFVLDRQIHKLKNNLRRSETASEQLQEKMTRIAESCESVDDLPARLKQVYVMLHKKNEAVKASNKKLSQAVEHFSEQIDDPARGEVVVHETLHRGVLIRMGEHYWQTESELKGLKVIYDGTQKKITTTAA